MEHRTVRELAVVAVRAGERELCEVIDRGFRRDPGLRSVVVDLVGGGFALIDRLRFENALTGPFGYGRALHQRKACVSLADRSPLVLTGDETTTAVAARVLSRPPEQRYADAIVRDGDNVRTLSVAVLLESLAEVNAHRALHDPLTELPNRAHVMEHLERLAVAHRPGRQLAVAFVDVDGFKRVNDSLGHAAGDELLRIVGARLQAAVRADELVGRMGGDEFVAVLNVASRQEARRIAERFIETFATPIVLTAGTVQVEASVGLAFTGAEPFAPGALLRESDQAMYSAKQQRGSRLVEVGDGSPDAGVVASLAELAGAIAGGDLVLHYQPIVELGTGATTAVEALVRWPRTDGSLRSPGAFIPLAESTGMIVELGRWVLDEACRQLAQWDVILGPRSPGVMSVNLSAHQLAEPTLIGDVQRSLAMAGLAPSRLCLEVTETAVMRDVDQARECLAELRRIGVGIALDDFGVGQSSLAQLTRLPLSSLKVDQSFVGRMLHADADHRVVRLIASLGHGLGMPVIAEGVEESAQAGALRDLGCERAQGFHFSPPLPADELVHHLAADPAANNSDTCRTREPVP